MKKKARFTFLGTSGSMGIPIIGCTCEVCKSEDQHNKRLRPSALIQFDDFNYIIDIGPDFRFQALQHHINHVNGILFTHGHHDHTAGVDELRAYYLLKVQTIPCLMSKETFKEMELRFHYIFKKKNQLPITFIENSRGILIFENLKVGYMSYEQIGMKVNGFRLGNLAYITDISSYPETIFEDLAGTEILILSALRWEPSPIHFSVDDAVKFSQKVGAKQTWLTHLAHELEHKKTNAYLPSNVRLAYDGLSFDFMLELEEHGKKSAK